MSPFFIFMYRASSELIKLPFCFAASLHQRRRRILKITLLVQSATKKLLCTKFHAIYQHYKSLFSSHLNQFWLLAISSRDYFKYEDILGDVIANIGHISMPDIIMGRGIFTIIKLRWLVDIWISLRKLFFILALKIK